VKQARGPVSRNVPSPQVHARNDLCTHTSADDSFDSNTSGPQHAQLPLRSGRSCTVGNQVCACIDLSCTADGDLHGGSAALESQECRWSMDGSLACRVETSPAEPSRALCVPSRGRVCWNLF
jgi:hypothetical protein